MMIDGACSFPLAPTAKKGKILARRGPLGGVIGLQLQFIWQSVLYPPQLVLGFESSPRIVKSTNI